MILSEVFGRRPLISHLLILFTFPLILILINNNWIFTPPGPLPDPWFYLANFLFLPDLVSSFPSNTHYFVERVNWNLVGYEIYHVFPPRLANTILHLLVYYVAVFSLYFILSVLFNKRTALLSALALGSYPWFLRAVGWDYTDGFGIAHYLLIMLLLTQAVYAKKWSLPFLIAGGIAHASMLISNQFWVGFAPSLGIFYLLLEHHVNKLRLKRLLLAAAGFVAGNLVLTGLVGFIYFQMTGRFHFLENSVEFSSRIANDAYNRQNVIDFYGQMPPYWHLLPLLIAIGIIYWLFFYRVREKEQRHFVIVVTISFVLSFGWLIFWHYYAIPYLIVFLYSSYLIPTIFLLFGALLASPLERMNSNQFTRLAFWSILICLAPLLLTTFFPSVLRYQHNDLLIAALGLGFVLSITVFRQRQLVWMTILALVLIGFLGGKEASVYVKDRFRGQDNFVVLMEAVEIIEEKYPKHEYSDFQIWYRYDSNAATNLAISSLYLYPWGSTINMNPGTDFSWPDDRILSEGNIILLSDSTDYAEIIRNANRALIRYDSFLELQSYRRIVAGDIHLSLLFLKLVIQPLQINEVFDFDRPFGGSNWYSLEVNANDLTFVWSGPDSESTMDVELGEVEGDVQIQICVIAALDVELYDSFRLLTNEREVPVTRTKARDCPVLFEGLIPVEYMASKAPYLELTFQIDHTVSPADISESPDSRSLGLAFDWIVFREIE